MKKIGIAVLATLISQLCLASNPETALGYDTEVVRVLEEEQYTLSNRQTLKEARDSGQVPVFGIFKTNLSHLRRSIKQNAQLIRSDTIVSSCPAGTREEIADKYPPVAPCKWLTRSQIQGVTGVKEGPRTKHVDVPAASSGGAY
jgi:hypothetical protein